MVPSNIETIPSNLVIGDEFVSTLLLPHSMAYISELPSCFVSKDWHEAPDCDTVAKLEVSANFTTICKKISTINDTTGSNISAIPHFFLLVISTPLFIVFLSYQTAQERSSISQFSLLGSTLSQKLPET